MKRILYVSACDISRGGVQKCIQSWVENFPHRDEFDITWYCPGSIKNQEYYDYLTSLGIHIVLGNISSGVKGRDPQYRRDLQELLETEKYDIFHVNTGGIITTYYAVKEAKKHKIPRIVSHSHNAPQRIGRMKKLVAPYFRQQIIKNSDLLLACSDIAGRHLFGKAAIKKDNYHLIRNGIQLKQYAFDTNKRNEIRKKAECREKLVFGHVGAFNQQKNPLFLLEMFAEIHKRDGNAVLWMIGDGDLRPEIEQKITELGLSDCVVLWGERDDVPELMQGMDAFLFPSLFEGLGIVAIEAQAAGLPVYASDVVPEEAAITDLLHRWPLEDGAEKWAERIINEEKTLFMRMNMADTIENAGYSSKNVAVLLEELYQGVRENGTEGQYRRSGI